jgi:hypothetical protein
MTETQNPMQKLWQDQPLEGIKMSAKELRLRAGKFERRIRWTNMRETVASLIAVGLFVYFLATSHDWLSRITFGLFIVAMLWIVGALYRKGSAKKLPEGADTQAGVRFYRAELERQYEVVKNVWWWYLAPLVPGFVVYTIGFAVKFPRPGAWAGLAVMDVIVAGMFYVIWRMNMRAARCLRRMIQELGTE